MVKTREVHPSMPKWQMEGFDAKIDWQCWCEQRNMGLLGPKDDFKHLWENGACSICGKIEPKSVVSNDDEVRAAQNQPSPRPDLEDLQ